MNNNSIWIAFDIETSAVPYESLSPSQQEYLIRNAKSPEEEQKKKEEMALYPYTSQVVTIGMKLIEKQDEEFINKSVVALMNNAEMDEDTEPIITEENNIIYIQANEKKILEIFWKTIDKYKKCTLISFNGRNFDAPFLMLRSAVLEIMPTRNLMEGTKFNYSNHIDLIDELTFYSNSTYGPTRKFNFDFFTRAFGLTSPKSEGVDGSHVGDLFRNKEYKTIADYCLRDVEATWALYLRVKDYLFIR
ncbi:MAG: 3'-5' exonuclease [Candidatus Kapaibacteriota bacterium]